MSKEGGEKDLKLTIFSMIPVSLTFAEEELELLGFALIMSFELKILVFK